MKKIIALILSLIMLFAFAGCGKDDAEQAESDTFYSEETENKIEIETLSESEPDSEAQPYEEINVNADIGSVTITTGEEFSFKVRNTNNKWLKTEKTDTSFSVTYSPQLNGDGSNGINSSTHELQLTLPKNRYPKEINIKMGAGQLKINDIFCGVISVEQGAGNVDIDGVEAMVASFRSGAGKFTAKNLDIKNNLNITGGMGYSYFQGKPGSEIKVDGGIGAIKLDIDGKRTNYSVEGNNALRPLYINGKVFGHGSSEDGWQTIDGDTSFAEDPQETHLNRIVISGGVGRVDVNFTH